MIILNFSHSISYEQLNAIEKIMANRCNPKDYVCKVDQVIQIPVQFDNDRDFSSQVHDLIKNLPEFIKELQDGEIIINLPSLNYIAVMVILELRKVLGFFPFVIRLKRAGDTIPPKFELAEMIDLEGL